MSFFYRYIENSILDVDEIQTNKSSNSFAEIFRRKHKELSEAESEINVNKFETRTADDRKILLKVTNKNKRISLKKDYIEMQNELKVTFIYLTRIEFD